MAYSNVGHLLVRKLVEEATGQDLGAALDGLVFIAYAQDGKPLPSLRMVIPGDSHAGRSVHDLVLIEVR